ncbi:MAG: hypothetical protein FWF88_07425 [Peptococcaceae bacterium]|nr:hypothetical protein [Peptococcaceae bacterium]
MPYNPGLLARDWKRALCVLKEGNRRFVCNQTLHRDTSEQGRLILADGQQPIAVVVTCSDSRVSPEIFFDQTLGDIFVVRNAGNIADDTALGAIEYAVKYLRAPLVVVVGHNHCGAVAAAYEQHQQESGHGGYGRIKDNLNPKGDNKQLDCENNHEFPDYLQSVLDVIRLSLKDISGLDGAVVDNTLYAVARIQNNETVKNAGTKVLGAAYCLVTGEVSFLS